ncbi:protein SIEVE ELEMENT OCCLUSION B [Pistacia vera]|uniref:protein SIEVE ELEMENT OCCLUSION B n=1 Tax=Pistacia vera TaxID=55513 RepID=UPI0012634CD9|nr:protein SIEVE ELEMENT OCCLUSION B [Pistacia vera]
MAYWSSGSGADTQKLIRGDRGMVAMSDDNIMMKQIIATHTPDGREVDVKPLFFLVQDILNRATFQVDIPEGVQAQMEIEDKSQQAGLFAMIDAISFTIDRISCEIAYKALGGSDAHATTVSLFSLLATYSWDAKLVLTLAAFALNYGEFWLLAQIYPANQLAKSMAILKQLPSLMENTGPLKARFDALNNLIKAMMDVTKCVIEFKELPSAYIHQDVAAFSTAMTHIPIAVYWTIRSIVACATQITMLTSMGHDYAVSTTESWELSTLAHKLKTIYEHLRKQLATCYQYIEEKKSLEAYQMLLHLFETLHVDNMKILRALIYAKDDLLPLVDGASKKRVSIDVLRRKNVLLLISGLDFSHEELSILEQIYSESRQQAGRLESQFEVVWIPIVDRSIEWNEAMQKQFEILQASMSWYTVHHPTLIEKAVIKFIKEVWHFKNRPILVVLDPQGRVVCPKAIHMMWIWGSNAFPFTSMREEALWKEEAWRLELLVDGIDPMVLNWIREGKYIFLYGGDDLEWIRKFTNAARTVATAARIPLEMVYVGKSTKREQVRRIMASIQIEKLSQAWPDLTMVWFFWTRLESMLFSKIQLGRADDQDPMMQEIKKLLSYDRDGGWAVLSKGSQVVVNGHGTTIVPALLEYDIWKENVPVKGFDVSFKEHHQKLHGIAHPCCRFEFSSHFGRTPHSMTCPECLRVMEKFTTFCCCHDDHVPGIGSSSLY